MPVVNNLIQRLKQRQNVALLKSQIRLNYFADVALQNEVLRNVSTQQVSSIMRRLWM